MQRLIFKADSLWRELALRVMRTIMTSKKLNVAALGAGKMSARDYFIETAEMWVPNPPKYFLNCSPVSPIFSRSFSRINRDVDAVVFIGTILYEVIDPRFIVRIATDHPPPGAPPDWDEWDSIADRFDENGEEVIPLRQEVISWHVFSLRETSISRWTRVDRFLGPFEDRHEYNARCREELFNAKGERLILHLPGNDTVVVDILVLLQELIALGSERATLNSKLRGLLLNDLGFHWRTKSRDCLERMVQQELNSETVVGLSKA